MFQRDGTNLFIDVSLQNCLRKTWKEKDKWMPR